MANSSFKIVDNSKRLLIKLHGDTAEAGGIRIDSGSLWGALNANNRLLGTGSDRKSTYRLTLRKAYASISGDTPGAVKLYFDNQTDVGNTLISFTTGTGYHKLNEGGEPFTVPYQFADTKAGNVWMQTVGLTSNVLYTLILDFRKDNRDYDAGQANTPTDFNFR